MNGKRKLRQKNPSSSKIKQKSRRRVGSQAAFDELVTDELCIKLAGKFASKSAKKTGDNIGSIKDCYETIALELVCVRASKLRAALLEEFQRDRKGLMRFLSTVFQHWRNIYQPNSLWRVRLVTQQIALKYGYDRKRILDHLQKIGAVPNNLTANQTYAWLSRIGQYLSRDQRIAAAKSQ